VAIEKYRVILSGLVLALADVSGFTRSELFSPNCWKGEKCCRKDISASSKGSRPPHANSRTAQTTQAWAASSRQPQQWGEAASQGRVALQRPEQGSTQGCACLERAPRRQLSTVLAPQGMASFPTPWLAAVPVHRTVGCAGMGHAHQRGFWMPPP